MVEEPEPRPPEDAAESMEPEHKPPPPQDEPKNVDLDTRYVFNSVLTQRQININICGYMSNRERIGSVN